MTVGGGFRAVLWVAIEEALRTYPRATQDAALRDLVLAVMRQGISLEEHCEAKGTAPETARRSLDEFKLRLSPILKRVLQGLPAQEHEEGQADS